MLWVYWRTACLTAFHSARRFIVHKPLPGIGLTVCAYLLQWYVLGLRGWDDTVRVIATLLTPLIALGVILFLWYLLNAPVKLADAAEARLREAFAAAQQSPYLDDKEREVRRLLDQFSHDRRALEVVRFLLPRGEAPQDVITGYMNGDTGGAFQYFRSTSLVSERIEHLPGALGTCSHWRIPEEFKPILEKVLYEYIKTWADHRPGYS